MDTATSEARTDAAPLEVAAAPPEEKPRASATNRIPSIIGAFVVNGGVGGAGFRFHCCHQSCLVRRGDGQHLDRLTYLRQMLELGWLSLTDLQNPDFGCGPISSRAYHEHERSSSDDKFRVVDRDGYGVDVGVFHANIIARAGRFDFDKLNAVCGTQIAADVTEGHLVGQLRSR